MFHVLNLVSICYVSYYYNLNAYILQDVRNITVSTLVSSLPRILKSPDFSDIMMPCQQFTVIQLPTDDNRIIGHDPFPAWVHLLMCFMLTMWKYLCNVSMPNFTIKLRLMQGYLSWKWNFNVSYRLNVLQIKWGYMNVATQSPIST
jgi:hypothetical protein